jgi:hypothetical protein
MTRQAEATLREDSHGAGMTDGLAYINLVEQFSCPFVPRKVSGHHGLSGLSMRPSESRSYRARMSEDTVSRHLNKSMNNLDSKPIFLPPFVHKLLYLL